jgi:hypothetical protein
MRPHSLHLVRPEPEHARARATPAPGHGDRGDLALMAFLFLVCLVPFVGDATTRGGWGAGTLGLATAGALFTGRELVRGARTILHRRR